MKPGFYRDRNGSLPSRERGLKLYEDDGLIVAMLSLPSRERGLKFYCIVCVLK